MEEWKEYKLGDLYDVHNGLSKGGKFFGSGYPFLSFKTVFNNYFLPAILPDLVQSNEKEQKGYDIKRGDVFVTRTSETPEELGMSSVALKDYPSATYNGFTKRLRPKNTSLVYPEFIGYYLRSSKFRALFYGLASSMSTRASLANGDLLGMRVFLPSYDTQERIANILKSLDDKIEVNKRINDNLEQQAQTLFKSWFVDFEPFRDQPFVESELGMIPEGWKVGSFLDNIYVMPGGTPSTNVDEYWKDGTIPFFSPKDVNGVYCFETEKNITELGLNNCSSRLYPKDTLFITARGTVGKIALAGVPMAMNQSNYALAAKEGVGKFYLYLLTQTLVSTLLKKANGAVFSAITTKDFNEPNLIPANNVMDSFEVTVKPFFDKIFQTSEESRRLASLRDTLLPRLMSGELKVNEIDNAI